MNFRALLAALAAGFLVGGSVHADDLAVYDFTNQPGSQNEQAAAQTAPGVIAEPLKRGPGVEVSTDVPGTMSATKWTTDPTQISGNDYFELTVGPTDKAALTLQEIQFFETVSAKGPTALIVRSSLDNFESDLGDPFLLDPKTPGNPRILALDQRFASLRAPVCFRFYAYGSRSSNGGVWGLGHAGEGGVLKIVGTVNADNP